MKALQLASRSSLSLLSLIVAAGLMAFSSVNVSSAGSQPAALAAANKHIGSNKCENCHNSAASGDQFGHWSERGHSNAFKMLTSEESLKVGKEHGIADPSKADECLRCHVTGHGLDKKQFKKSFDMEEGVGCESCHGPGDNHARARFRAANAEEDEEEGFGDEEAAPAYAEIPAGEIGMEFKEELCLKCHNEESPTYKPFCFHCRMVKIRHLNPLKPRTEAEKKALDCGCDGEKKCDHDCPL
jgi:hypothetical protein